MVVESNKMQAMMSTMISTWHMPSLHIPSYHRDRENQGYMPLSIDLLIPKAALENKEMIFMKYIGKLVHIA